ncbi:MAG: hypothetical protein FWE62_06445, partial [Firmicutes bacterium]|nr:hypothetical protein [Bacillota bacterium]
MAETEKSEQTTNIVKLLLALREEGNIPAMQKRLRELKRRLEPLNSAIRDVESDERERKRALKAAAEEERRQAEDARVRAEAQAAEEAALAAAAAIPKPETIPEPVFDQPQEETPKSAAKKGKKKIAEAAASEAEIISAPEPEAPAAQEVKISEDVVAAPVMVQQAPEAVEIPVNKESAVSAAVSASAAQETRIKPDKKADAHDAPKKTLHDRRNIPEPAKPSWLGTQRPDIAARRVAEQAARRSAAPRPAGNWQRTLPGAGAGPRPVGAGEGRFGAGAPRGIGPGGPRPARAPREMAVPQSAFAAKKPEK